MFKCLGNLADMAGMMKQAREMQARLADLQDGFARTIVMGESGGGLVRVRATAKGDVTGLEISPHILVASEKERVEDLILAAIQDAQGQGQALMARDMRKLSDELGLPADMKLPF